jgi:zinc and cadmium transporter
MLSYALILLVAALGGGALARFYQPAAGKSLKLWLVFAGAYLFSVTVVHLLPELFMGVNAGSLSTVGMWVLAGFYLQLILEFFSSGVEHGHVHAHTHINPVMIVSALFLHAFLEGTLLFHPDAAGELHNTNALLTGIVLHKLPAGFALMAMLHGQRWALPGLLLFALASPAGMFLSNTLQDQQSWAEVSSWLYPLVAGGFLHISTTIFFENSPEHNFNLHKLLVALAGAGLALLSEFLV